MYLATSLTEADLEAYFQRIGYAGSRTPTLATLQGIHQRHPQAIAFENLSSFLGQPVELDLPSLVQKLVYGGRGGYCFEQNGLLLSVLTTLGFRVTGLGGRVRWQTPPDILTSRSHMALLVDLEGESYIADVGFGGMTLTAPLRLVSDLEQETSHERFRLVQSDQGFTIQSYVQDWEPLYQFDLQPQYLCDYRVSNWYVSTHPESIFVSGLIVTRVDSDRRYILRNTQLITHAMTGQTEKQPLTSVEQLEAVLTDVFRLKLPETRDFSQLFLAQAQRESQVSSSVRVKSTD
ncbi:MAG: arylamine N-acetyltransferase [Nodosilinea sp.]